MDRIDTEATSLQQYQTCRRPADRSFPVVVARWPQGVDEGRAIWGAGLGFNYRRFLNRRYECYPTS
jgi:hypothetical protein